MKTRVLLFVFTLIGAASMQAQNLYESLKDVNERWAYEKNLPPEIFELPAEENPIQTHLFWVHRILSERPTDHLNNKQKQNRLTALQHLAQYAEAGVFPKNLYHAKRQPVFIDPYNTYCAVGYLIKTSGHDPLARKISREMNYAYLLDMEMKELNGWVGQSGFTPEELAWIQPGYPAIQNFQSMKAGIDGNVNTIIPLSSGDLLAAGTFDTAGTVAAGSIGNWISGIAGFDWVPFGGTGVEHDVHDMLEWNGNIVVAGDIWQAGSTGIGSSVAMWDGSQWSSIGDFYIGALPNIVYDLEVYNNELYAAGWFRSKINATSMFQNFAKWDGSEWVGIGTPNAPVHSLTVHNGKLILGGAFEQIDGVTYNRVAAWDGTQFSTLANGVTNTVYALETHDGNLFAGCQLLSSSQQDTFAVGYFDGSQWTRVIGESWQFSWQTNLQSQSVKALESTPYGLFIGGNIVYPGFGTNGRNLLHYKDGWVGGFGVLDSTVNSLVYMNNNLYIGGEFTHANNGGGMTYMNHITYVDVAAIFSTDELSGAAVALYPNPAQDHAQLTFENPVHVQEITISNIAGQALPIQFNEEGSGRYSMDVSHLSGGTHVLNVRTDAGTLERKLVIVR
ncbi:MAG TPA: hypothetical protein DCG19_00665 [Cryomorphaceae bacterium]|nr:hypothetical protein [Owenweeksia sp.]MBF98610.1 hypothetical protein [Owenweeksia sp.]HAD95880.1 hypothetical protein [Cryomorphaceae bacterium]HBF21056.1 hypothetical protein [Cryomorphaceae bacterium]HCQ16119.1 hypothetical protein [Cryomorphaceae bacterium]|tara:strand:+ start:94 stop:1944 length:1851 start_codon:yes stop_codon:yes gene_type:complete